MNLDEVLDFFYKYSPNFTERYEKDGVKFLFSEFVNDYYSNFAIVESAKDIKIANEVFKQRGLTPIYYSKKIPKGYETVFEDDLLVFENPKILYKKFKRLKNKSISLVAVTKPLQKKWKIVTDLAFKEPSADNPYANLDNFAYCEGILYFIKHESACQTQPYLIKYKGKFVGTITVSFAERKCYITGFAIMPDFRRTKVFLSMINVLEVLLEKGVETIICFTELGEYPNKLYKNIGFKSVGHLYAYKLPE